MDMIIFYRHADTLTSSKW